jgi:hypothetical protein
MNVLRDPIKTELVLIVFESIFLIGEVIVLALVVLVLPPVLALVRLASFASSIRLPSELPRS